MKVKSGIPLLFVIIIIFSFCTNKTIEKDKKEVIVPIANSYSIYKDNHISFQVSELAIIKPVDSGDKIGSWFNISYPDYKATIYCSFLPINKENLYKALDDSYHLAYRHTTRADGIKQNLYANEYANTYGIIYDIEGQVAVPIQFFLTDSISNFFRGSLYYDEKISSDSLKLINKCLREDIVKLMETLRWQH